MDVQRTDEQINQHDLALIACIKEITQRGNHAEVRKYGEGYTVHEELRKKKYEI